MKDKDGVPFGLGPVFVYEWLIASRRWQTYALRSGFVVALLIALYAMQNSSRTGPQNPTSIRALATIGANFCVALVGTQLTLVLLAAPAATAGAICLDRARGTLTHLLVTDLSDREIVLGKLAGRLASVLILVCCTLPVMSLLTLLGGVDPVALVGAFAVTVGVALLGACLAFLFSLWAGKTHEALLGTYAIWGLWILGGPMFNSLNASFSWLLPDIPDNANPYILISAPYLWPGTVGWSESFIFLAVCAAISAVLVLITVLRLRPICSRDDGVRQRRSRRLGRQGGGLLRENALRRFVRKLRPSLDGNPVLWREWHRARPSRWSVIVGTLYVVLAAAFSGLAIWSGRSPSTPGLVAWVNGLQVAIGLLLLSVTAATSLAEERVRGSLDVLMVTPLSTRQIVLGKWLGTFRVVPLLAVLPALVILGCGKDYERLVGALFIAAYVIASGAAVTSVGLALATWIPRLGRAVALTVTLYVLVTVGWLFVVQIFAARSESLLIGSPFFWAVAVSLRYGHENTVSLEEVLSLAPFWLFFNAIVAIGFLALTLATFNRCMGRVEYHVTRSPLLRRDRKRQKSEPALRL